MNQPAPPAAATVFRQAALDRLSSPEQLDRVIKVTAARDWFGAVALCLLLAVGAVWSVFGSIPTLVRGSGILIATGGRVFEAFASGDGTVIEILAKVGDPVERGDLLARISQPGLQLALENAKAVVAERRTQYEGRKRQVESYTTSRSENNRARQQALTSRIAYAEQRATAVAKQLESEEKMFEQRLITWQKLHESRQDLASARQTVLEAKSQLVQIDAEEISARNSDERDMQLSAERLAEAERQILELQLQLQQRERVLSPASGRVNELRAVAGGRVGAGTAIVSIESGVTGLQLILYLPPDQGKQVKPGMEVRISPSTVKRESFGTMTGAVTEVSDFPSTTQAMFAVLGNERLIQQFSPKGPPFASRVDLTRDPAAPTGYRWSGGVGPTTTLSSGTIAEAEVTVKQSAPISFVIPVLRKMTGMDR